MLAPTFFCLFVRALGVVSILPLGRGLLAVPNKLLVALVLAFSVLPQVAGVSNSFSLLEVFADFLLGLFIALPFALVVDAAHMLGQLFDTGRGQNIAQMYDPTVPTPETSSAVLANYFTWAMIVGSGGLISLHIIFVESVGLYPPGRGAQVVLQSNWSHAIAILCDFWRNALFVSVPVLLLFLLVDAALSFLARALPQVMLHSEVFIVKTALGTVAALTMLNSRFGELISRLHSADLLSLSWLGSGATW